jgi:hypothetical protein
MGSDLLMTNGFRVVRTVGVLSVLIGSMSPSVQAQQPSDSSDPATLQKIRTALTQPQLVTTGAPSLFDGTRPDGRQFGVLTFLPPDTPGEFIRVRVPVGALVSRAAHSAAAAQHRRAEKSAHDDVIHVAAALQKPPTK